MPDIRMMAFDLDGTLLGKDGHISPRNRAALQEAHRRGIKLVIASGRGFQATRRFAKEAGVPCILATANGARIDESQDGPLLCERCLDDEASKIVMQHMYDSGIFFVSYQKHANYQGNMHTRQPAETAYFAPGMYTEDGVTVEMVEDDERMHSEGWHNVYKFVAFSTAADPNLEVLAAKIRPLGLSVESSWINNIEVMPPEGGKGNALDYLAKRYGFDREQVMVFGDNFNDESMLRYAGWPVVMENGVAEMKAIARIIAPHHDADGVGRVIEQYVLLGEEN